MRFFLLEFLVAIIAFGFGWLVRRILGRLIGGPPVIIWGIGAGLISVILCGVLFAALGTDLGFINFNGDLFDGAKVFLIRFWELGLIGGGLGAVIASLMIKRKPPNPPKPPA